MEQLDGDDDFIARFGAIEEHDRLQVFTHRDPAAVEVDDFRHRSVRRGVELEPDARAAQVVAVERLRHLDNAAKPHRLIAHLNGFGSGGPLADVKIGRLAMRHIAGVIAPAGQRQRVQRAQALHRLLGLRV
jgi:hypothetical protein